MQPGETLQQLLKERDALRQLLNEQLETTSAHTARINGLEQDLMDMQSATKLASQVCHPRQADFSSCGACVCHEATGVDGRSWRARSGLHAPSFTDWHNLLQAATEQAARALALYAKEAQELRDQLVQAQARNSRGSGTFAAILKSARGSFLRRGSSSAIPEEVRSPP